MADGFTPQDPMSAPPGPLPSDDSSRGFLGTPRGRIVAIVGAVVVLAVIAGLALYFLVPDLFGKDDEGGVKPSASAPKAPTGASATGAAGTVEIEPGATEPEAVPLNDIFTFRDIFDPLFPEAEPQGTPNGNGNGSGNGTDGGTGTPDVSENALLLEDIVVLDGVPYAYLLWNGDEHVLAEGESIPGTPWQVLSIGENSVVMLFGDVQVPLTIGQAVSK